MKRRISLIVLLIFTLTMVTGCELLDGIFKTGIGIGIFIAVAIMVLIFFIGRIGRGKKM